MFKRGLVLMIEIIAGQVSSVKRKTGHSQLRRVIGPGNRRNNYSSALYIGDSADSLSSPSDDSEEDDDDDDDEDDDSSANGYDDVDGHNNDRFSQARNRIGNLNDAEGNNDEDEDDDDRDIEDEEEDAYFNMDDEEDVESGVDGEVEGEDINNGLI